MQEIFIQGIGLTAGILTASSFIPQLIKVWKTKEVDDLSAFMLITRGIGLALWIVYGSIKPDLPVLITCSLSFLINSAVTFLKVRYSGQQK